MPSLRYASTSSKALVLGCLLALATLALYHPVNHFPFANADDDSYVSDNSHVKYGFEPDTVKWAFTTFRDANWHPLTWLSHALDCHLYSLDAGKHHRTNALLHAANVVLLFWVLLQATGYVGRSAMVAALFAVHPINVESVVWISERKNLLSMFFFLLALGAYRWYAKCSFQFRVSSFKFRGWFPGQSRALDPAGSNSNLETRNWKLSCSRYLVVMLLFAMGLMSKPQVITFPFVLLLWDYWPLRRMFTDQQGAGATGFPPRSFSWLVVEKLPLFALSAASAVVTIKAQRIGGAMSGPLNTYPFLLRLQNAIVSYVRYIGKALWPSRLAFMYPHAAFAAWQVILALLLLLIVTVLALRFSPFALRRSGEPANSELRGSNGGVLVGWLWFLGTLVPMIGFVQVGAQAMADRYAYLPFIGLFIMVCWGVGGWAQQKKLATGWIAAPALVVLLVLAVVAHRQISYWSDNVTLWAHTVQVTSGNWIAEDNWGAALLDEGRLEEAIGHFRAAEAISPHDPRTFLFIGFYEQQRGNLRVAIEQYQRVLDVTQNDVWDNAKLRDNAYINMGYAYRDLGDWQRADESFAAAERQRREFLRNTTGK